MRLNDAALGSLLLAVALAVGLYARTLPAIPGQQFGAAVFPTTVAVALGGLSLILIAGGLRRRGTVAGPDDEETPSRTGLLRLLLAFGGVVFYILAAGPLGFLPVSALILLVLCLALGTRWWAALLVAIGVTLLIHLLFVGLLKVQLPWGLVPPFSW